MVLMVILQEVRNSPNFYIFLNSQVVGLVPMNYHIPRSEVSNGKVSHKLAERRRRRELKALFEELRREVPAIRNHSKASKWDILNAGTSFCNALIYRQI